MDLLHFHRPGTPPYAVVYLWQATMHLDNREKTNLYRELSLKDWNQLTIYRSVGHVGIGLYYNGEFIYKGFSPVTIQKDMALLNPVATFEAGFKSYEEDTAMMEARPTKSVSLYHVDFEKLYAFLKRPVGNWHTYSLYKRNCSTFVMQALKVASGGRKPSFWKRTKNAWNNLLDVTNIFAWLLPTNTPQQRQYWATQAMKTNPFLAADHLFKTFGDTPDAVLQYTTFLQLREWEEIGR